MGRPTIYAKLEDGRVGILHRVDSNNQHGKWRVTVKGDDDPIHINMVTIVPKEQYDMYDPKPTKQPAKRGGKK